jgi:hypothetical protein
MEGGEEDRTEGKRKFIYPPQPGSVMRCSLLVLERTPSSHVCLPIDVCCVGADGRRTHTVCYPAFLSGGEKRALMLSESWSTGARSCCMGLFAGFSNFYGRCRLLSAHTKENGTHFRKEKRRTIGRGLYSRPAQKHRDMPRCLVILEEENRTLHPIQ